MGQEKLAIHGGRPVRRSPWPSFADRDGFIDERDVRAAMRPVCNRLLFRYDWRPVEKTEVHRFEEALRAHFGVKHALAVSSGTAAITLGLMAAGIRPGDEVACPAYTFAATPSAILLAGAVPVLVEVDEDLHLDVADLERKLSPRTKAIVVVHMGGFASDMEPILEVARGAGVPVIEDAVPALGATLGGKPLGTFGAVGCFSTQADKTVNTGEGGFLLTDDTQLFARALLLSGAYEGRAARHFKGGKAPLEDLSLPLFNFRMDEIRGAVAASQLRKVPRKVARLGANFRAVTAALAEVPGIALRRPVAPGATLGARAMFRLPGAEPERVIWFARALSAEGIHAVAVGGEGNSRVFWNWRFLFPGQSQAEVKRRLPSTTRHLSESISLELRATLEAKDCRDLIAAVKKVAAYYVRSRRRGVAKPAPSAAAGARR
jgi:dTDP-4-amino-4,6-dideoxygalactose transaminase